MIHCSAAAFLLLLVGIFLLFVSSSQSYATAIDTNDDDTDKDEMDEVMKMLMDAAASGADYMTDEEIESDLEKYFTLWPNDTDTEVIDEVRKTLIDAMNGENHMFEEMFNEIMNVDDEIENNPESKLSYKEKKEMMFSKQDDLFNIYERWRCE